MEVEKDEHKKGFKEVKNGERKKAAGKSRKCCVGGNNALTLSK